MTSHRYLFYSEDATASSRVVTLTGTEHHHFARVLRFKAGQELFVTNGRGLILLCLAETVGRANTDAVVTALVQDGPPARELVLALAAIRKDKFERAFEQCVELGITRCLPFFSANSQRQRFAGRYLDRLRKIAITAIKQSFRPYLPRVGEPASFDELVELTRKVPRTVVGRQGSEPLEPLGGGADVMIVVGPEAGLTNEEYDTIILAGAVPASVSKHRLRSETAAVAMVAALAGED